MVRDNVKHLAESFFSEFETRARRKAKDAFIERTKEGFREIGYTDAEMTMQQSTLGGKNLVVGKPDAVFIFIAHYDTPARNGWLVLAFSKMWGMGFASLFGTLVIILLSSPGIVLDRVDISPDLALFIRWVLLLVIISLFVIKNPHNHNDNTSGCLGVYNVATIVAGNPALREKCAFVLFDMEEQGLLGSSAFAKWRRKQYPGRDGSRVINLDCIADGDVLVVASRKKQAAAAERSQLAEFLQAEGFETVQKTSSLLGYLSDHANFQRGVMLAFLRRSKLGGLYIPNIHTSRDTACDLEQIERLSQAVVKYVSGDFDAADVC